MFHLLILNDCCSDGIIVEASDVFGYRVWVLVYRVWCYHPSRSCLPASCQIVLSASWFLPCWLLFILLVHSSYSSFQLLSAEARRSLIVIAIGSVVNGEWLVFRDSYRDSVSRILDGGFMLI